MAGRASVELKSRELGLDLGARPDVISKVVERVKQREAEGWSYEAADASFELLVRDELGEVPTRFAVESYRVIIDRREDGALVSEATVKVQADGQPGHLHQGGQRAGQRPGPGAALRPRRGVSAAARVRADRLQGAHPAGQGHGRGHPRAGGNLRPATGMDHRRRARQRRRGVLAGSARCRPIRPAAGTACGSSTSSTAKTRGSRLRASTQSAHEWSQAGPAPQAGAASVTCISVGSWSWPQSPAAPESARACRSPRRPAAPPRHRGGRCAAAPQRDEPEEDRAEQCHGREEPDDDRRRPKPGHGEHREHDERKQRRRPRGATSALDGHGRQRRGHPSSMRDGARPLAAAPVTLPHRAHRPLRDARSGYRLGAGRYPVGRRRGFRGGAALSALTVAAID